MKITNEQKLEAVKKFLTENNIRFAMDAPIKKYTVALWIKKYRILVHLSDAHDQDFYNAVKRSFKPFFIREEESKEFVLEKMQNCIIDIMKQQQKHSMK